MAARAVAWGRRSYALWRHSRIWREVFLRTLHCRAADIVFQISESVLAICYHGRHRYQAITRISFLQRWFCERREPGVWALQSWDCGGGGGGGGGGRGGDRRQAGGCGGELCLIGFERAMHTGPGNIYVCVVSCIAWLRAVCFKENGSSTLVFVLKSTLSAFSEVLDDPPKYLNNWSTCACPRIIYPNHIQCKIQPSMAWHYTIIS